MTGMWTELYREILTIGGLSVAYMTIEREKPNIALIVLDTLRKDTFDKFFNWIPGKRYEQAWSTGSWTVPAHGSLFTGKLPHENGVHAKSEALDYEEPVLAEILRENGYTTRGFSSNAFVTPPFSYDRGFDHFENTWRADIHNEELFNWTEFAKETERTGISRFLQGFWECLRTDCKSIPSLKQGVLLKAEDLGVWRRLSKPDSGAQQFHDEIQSISFNHPEFLFMNLMEVHKPYKIPDEYLTGELVNSPGVDGTLDPASVDVDTETVKRCYDDAARYLSDTYKEIYKTLEKNFEYIITIGDHGEMFGEGGVWNHAYGIHPELVHVPLVISGPGLEGECHNPVSLADIYTTVLDLAGCREESEGQNVISTTESSETIVQRHGFSSMNLQPLKERHDQALVDEYDNPVVGKVCESGEYIYENLGTVRCHGTITERDIERELELVREDVLGGTESQSQEVDMESAVSEEVLDTLEGLGYR